MRAPIKTKPDPIVIEGSNFFHAGWIAGVLGQPEREFDDINNPTANEDCDAWREGWKMATETNFSITDVVARMCFLRQLTIRS